MRVYAALLLLAGCPTSPDETGTTAAALTQGERNVAACQNWLLAIQCGDNDYSTVIDCNVYDDFDCDVSEYFGCLVDHTTCDESSGVADTTGWTKCQELAACPE